MREPLIYGLWKVETELTGYHSHLNKPSEIQEAIDKLEKLIEKAKRLIK